MGNPFDLRGPEFLLFYLAFGAGVLFVMYCVQRWREEGPVPRIDTSDPYLIAYLRGGAHEAARVATVSLVDRGLLEEGEDDTLKAKSGEIGVRRPIEKALLALFRAPQKADVMFKAPSVEAACSEYDASLSRAGLLPDLDVRAQRRSLLGTALLILLGVAAIKIFVALGRGHTNIVILCIFALAFSGLAIKVVRRRRTRRGDMMVQDLRRLFGRLRDRSLTLAPGGATADAALLAAVFGVAALPFTGFAYAHRLFRKSTSDSSGGGSSCGSSCGSSSSSCGGGGGGSGSGCGGCGGGGD